jgi:hypothetical protein
MGSEVFFRDSILSPALTLGNGGGLRCLALCRFSVASPMLGLGADNQNATTGLISGESYIRYRGRTEGTERRGRMTGDAWRDGGREASGPHRDQRLAYQRMTPTPPVSSPTFA